MRFGEDILNFRRRERVSKIPKEIRVINFVNIETSDVGQNDKIAV
jgi:hypothetical protein